MNPTPFPSLVQRFFADYLVTQRSLSPQTVAAYRDTFRLLLVFLSAHLRRPIDQLSLLSLTADHVLAFLNHLEHDRGNCIQTRNLRLASIRCFVHFALGDAGPDFLAQGQRILAIPAKRCTRHLRGFLTRGEVEAVLGACSEPTWTSRRDRVLFTLLYNTGARVSEVTNLHVGDAQGRVVQLHGKGRKERVVPLWPQTWRLVQRWCRANHLQREQPLFTNPAGVALTRAGVAFRLRHALGRAARSCPSLQRRGISPHTFRHTTALHLLQAGVALEVIALWLGHESPVTTHHYVEADLQMKTDCLRALNEPPPPARHRRAQYPKLLAFLEAL